MISSSGIINLPLIGRVQARGKTEKELLDKIEMKLIPYIKNPVISLGIISYESFKVYISGTVRSPGMFILKQPTTIAQAIAAAGGLTNLSNGEIILLRRNKTGK